jgi:hypothetical protein
VAQTPTPSREELLDQAATMLRRWLDLETGPPTLRVATGALLDTLKTIPTPNPNAGLRRRFDSLSDALTELLTVAGLTDECENPTAKHLTRPNDTESFIVHADGGDAFRPGVVFARWSGDLTPENPTLRVHVPPMPRNHELAAECYLPGSWLSAYLDTVRDDPTQWRSLGSELANPSVTAEPVPIY